jgi:hypothetical protein
MTLDSGQQKSASPAGQCQPQVLPHQEEAGRVNLPGAGDDALSGRLPALRRRTAVDLPSQEEHEMKQYLLGVDQRAGPIPAPEVLKGISPDLDPRDQELKAAGSRGSDRSGSR